MKQVELIHFESCPYCKQAKRWMQELVEEHPELAKVQVEQIDEKLEPERLELQDLLDRLQREAPHWQ